MIDNIARRRFESFFKKSPEEDCWMWNGTRNPAGYGVFSYRYKGIMAHRVSFSIYKEPIPEKMFVCHKCDNTSCINPSHLFVGTARDNLMDCIQKGRANRARGDNHHTRKFPELIRRGESSGQSVLNEKVVSQIYRLVLAGGGTRSIFKTIGLVSETVIQKIISGTAWTHCLGVNGNPTIEQLNDSVHKWSKKLSKSNVIEIKQSLINGERPSRIAKRFNVCRATISDIKYGRVWKHI